MNPKPISSLLSFVLLASVLAGCGAVFVNEGSKNASLAVGLANPNAAGAKKADVPKDAKIVCSFDDGSTNMNSKLYGGSSGAWSAFSYAGNENNINSKAFVVAGGANSTSMAAHIFGTLVDKGDASYPEFDLSGKFRDSGYYDASNFEGIKFYYKCTGDDSALKRRFAICTAPTLPHSEGGTCTEGCYNHFGADLSPTAGEWVLKSYAFADMKRESGWGSPVTPPDLVDHLKEFMNIKWGHAANNAAGSYKIDFWVDEVEFF